MSAANHDLSSREDRTPLPTGDGERDGGWIVPDVSYVEPSRRFCAYCGRPIARRYWRESMPAGDLAFCQPAHAAMYANDAAQMGAGNRAVATQAE